MSFGYTFDRAPGAPVNMSDPRSYQRRQPPGVALEPIQGRLLRKFPQRIARGDLVPINGHTRSLPDGSPGGRPIPHLPSLMAPLWNQPMPPKTIAASRARTIAETKVQAARFLQKPRITLLQLSKPHALDAAKSLRGRPGDRFTGKPGPPVDFQGGYSRVFERNRAYPKDTSVAMKPLAPVGVQWGISLPIYGDPSSGAVGARFPKTR